MAYFKTVSHIALHSCCFLILMAALSVSSFQFQVGGERGWAKPPHNQTVSYNDWAGKNRFRIADTLYFKYQNDSVLVVDSRGYENCITTNPIAKFEGGNTVFKFDRSGFFYFISGEPGHCKSGQKLIVRVMHPSELEPPESAPAPQPGRDTDTGGKSGNDNHWDSDDFGPPRFNTAHKLAVASYVVTGLGGVWTILSLTMQEVE